MPSEVTTTTVITATAKAPAAPCDHQEHLAGFKTAMATGNDPAKLPVNAPPTGDRIPRTTATAQRQRRFGR